MIEIHCSNLQRVESCPGSLNASEGIETPESDIALSGTIIHAALHSWARGDEPDGENLGDRENLIYNFFRSEVEKLEQSHGGYMLRMPEIKLRVEYEGFALVGRMDLGLQPLDCSVHIIDYKTGYAVQVPAKLNRQLMGYVVMLYRTRPEWDEINAHLFSAGDPVESRFTCAVYDLTAIEAAEAYLKEIIRNALKPEAKRIPGDHCQYCPALGSKRCPETSGDIVAVKKDLTSTPSDILPVPARCLEIYDAIKAVERYSAAFLPALKEAVIKDPEAWKDVFDLKDGAKRRSFTSTESVCNRLIEQEGITAAEIWPEVSLTPSAVERIIRKKKVPTKNTDTVIYDDDNNVVGANKGIPGFRVKDIKPYIAETFGDLIEEKESAPSLIRVKGE